MSAAAPAGRVVSAYGKREAAQAEANVSEYNAEIAERNAELALISAAEKERRQRVIARKTLGSIRANYGASGVTMGGSAADVMAASAAEAEMDALNIKYQGELDAMEFRERARIERYKAKQTRKAGDIAAAADLLGAASYYQPPKTGNT